MKRMALLAFPFNSSLHLSLSVSNSCHKNYLEAASLNLLQIIKYILYIYCITNIVMTLMPLIFICIDIYIYHSPWNHDERAQIPVFFFYLFDNIKI